MNRAQKFLEFLNEDESLNEYIKKEGGEYCVYSHQTGKNFGCYKSRKSAENRLKQMAKFRNK
jgi:hypothetical protein